MYLSETQVKELFLKLQSSFSPCLFLFDAYSRLTAKYSKYQPSIRSTGAHIRWGADSPAEIERFGEGISYQSRTYLTDWDIGDLSLRFRLGFKIMGRFKTAREAHRIFLFRLDKQKT
jgi:O-methyltransferase involved in polyketide biosynthesis